MSYIESAKSYTGNDLETIFFRPMLSGPSASDLGVKIIYNMPLPTTIQLWSGKSDVLQSYISNGWSGGNNNATKQQKTISLNRVKAEMGFSAADYFSLVFEQISSRSDINMEDLSGTELEAAETELFRRSIAESIRATMWIGDTTNSSYNTFNGFLKPIYEFVDDETIPTVSYTLSDLASADYAVECFDELWDASNQKLKDLKAEGQLAFFVTSDIYNLYEKYLDSKGVDSAYVDAINGRPTLMYHGIPVIDIHIGSYLSKSSYDTSFCILTDRRNLVMAVNTADFPGAEIRMWYNPDEMENRQRAVFMAGCDIVDEDLISFARIVEEED